MSGSVMVSFPWGRLMRPARWMILRLSVPRFSKTHFAVRFIVAGRAGASAPICSSRPRLCASIPQSSQVSLAARRRQGM